LIASSGVRQKHLCDRLGVTKYTISRWCQPGEQSIAIKSAAKLAAVFDCSIESLAGLPTPPPQFSDAEMDMLQAYRGLTPLQQAKARIAIETIRSSNA
jgi:transcriptional regulator with XRE-family HTH domain